MQTEKGRVRVRVLNFCGGARLGWEKRCRLSIRKVPLSLIFHVFGIVVVACGCAACGKKICVRVQPTSIPSCMQLHFGISRFFTDALCGTADRSEEHLDVHQSSLRRVSLAARLPVFVFSLKVLVCTLHIEVGGSRTNAHTCKNNRCLCWGIGVPCLCTSGAEIHGVTPTIVRKIARQGGASQLKLVATTLDLINPSICT